MTATMAVARTLASKAPVATRYILEAVHRGLDVPLAQGQFLETALFGAIASTDDMKEGTKAFLEKRKAEWKGR
jgi:enoyl-CoA hydratase